MGVRPQSLRPATADAGMPHGTVQLTERLGSETVVDVKLAGGDKIIAALPQDVMPDPGRQVSFDFAPDQAHAFPET